MLPPRHTHVGLGRELIDCRGKLTLLWLIAGEELCSHITAREFIGNQRLDAYDLISVPKLQRATLDIGYLTAPALPRLMDIEIAAGIPEHRRGECPSANATIAP